MTVHSPRRLAPERLLLSLLVALSVVAAPLIAASASAADTRSLTVSGSGEVSAVPDVAILSVGAMTQADSAKQALDQVNAVVTQLLARARDLGIAERDLATRQMGVSPVYANRRNSDEAPAPVGYQANNTVEITIRALDSAGAVIDAMTAAGANSIGGLHFSIADPGNYEDEARRLAVRDAKRRAALIAEEAGVKLGPILTIQENGGYTPQPKLRAMAMEARTPVAPGETSVAASVTVVFSLID